MRRNERGSIAPIMAVAVGGLVVASLWAANAASLYAVKRETQKAADLAALAGAANIPLIGALSSGEPTATACGEAEALLQRNTAPFADQLASTKAGPRCVAGVTVEPLVDWTTINTVKTALANLTGSLGLNNLNLCNPLVAGTIDLFLTKLSGTDCQAVRSAVAGLPENLSPATVTPRVRVSVVDTVQAPVPLPSFKGSRTIHAQATARRRFKNLIVLPAVTTSSITGIATPVADAFSGVPMPLDKINPNPTAAAVRDTLIPRLWEANTRLNAALDPYLPSGIDMDLSQLILDVQDLYDPPLNASPVSPVDLAAEAARTHDPVVLLRIFRMPVLGIPALDFTAAYLTPLSTGQFRATPIPVADLTQARGIFGASLVG